MNAYLLDATAAGIAELDRSGRCRFLNAEARRALDLAEVAPGMDFHAAAHQHHAGQPRACGFWTVCKAGLATGRTVRGRTIFRPGGRQRLAVRYWLRPMPDGGGVLTFVPAGATVAQRERRFQAMIEHSADAIALLSAEGKFLYNSEASLLRILGYPAGDLLGQDAFAMIHRDDVSYVRGVFKQIVLQPGGTIQGVSYRCRRRDGTWRWLEATGANLLEAPEVRAVVINYRDVTDRRTVEEALEQELRVRRRLQAELQQAQKMEAVGRLAGGVAHDFNNLLTVINGHTELMLAREPAGPNQDAARQIQQAATRAARLTRQLLAFGRRQALAPQVVDLNFAVENMGEMLRRVIGEDVELQSVAAPGLWPVRADPGQIEQVVLNLALNARDAMPHGGRLLFETANVKLDEDYARQAPEVTPGDYALLAVTDTGIGMDAATKAQIFEPFFTTKQAGPGYAGGSGLGLATAYGIIKQSGGHISVYSEPGHGTTFRIYLPRLEAAAVKPGQEPPSAPHTIEPVPKGKHNILVVEDEPGVQHLVEDILADQGYWVQTASGPRQALEMLSGRIDLLLCDVVLPGMNGRELAGLMRAQQPQMRVLFMSGFTDRGVVNSGLLDTGADFLQKPFSAATLSAKIAEMFRVRRTDRIHFVGESGPKPPVWASTGS